MGQGAHDGFPPILAGAVLADRKNAQIKIFNEVARTAASPTSRPASDRLWDYDRFDVNDVKNNGFPPGAGVGWFPL